MALLILWCGFIGAWLLVAGPILQAALELREQDIARERIHAVRETIITPRHVSAWWWLLPPVKFFLEQRQSRRYEMEYIHALEPEDLEALVNFINKARGWLLVASGAFLIALKETYELGEAMHWPSWVIWLLGGALLVASLLNTVRQVKLGSDLTSKQQAKE